MDPKGTFNANISWLRGFIVDRCQGPVVEFVEADKRLTEIRDELSDLRSALVASKAREEAAFLAGVAAEDDRPSGGWEEGELHAAFLAWKERTHG